jgi:hypothetical protein
MIRLQGHLKHQHWVLESFSKVMGHLEKCHRETTLGVTQNDNPSNISLFQLWLPLSQLM